MARGLKELRDRVSRLSETDLERFAQWFSRLREQRDYQRRRNTKGGIPYRNLLKAFKKQAGRVPWIPWASMAASKMQKFYLTTRIKGCDPDHGDDALLIEWGPESKAEFKIAYTREVGPPRPPGRGEEVWHLTLDMRFPMSPELKRLKSGEKSFHCLGEVERDFYAYAVKSKIGEITRKLQPSRVTVTYENVE